MRLSMGRLSRSRCRAVAQPARAPAAPSRVGAGQPAGRADHQARSRARGRPCRASAAPARRATASSASGRVAVGTTPSTTVSPASRASASCVVVGRAEPGEVDGEPGRARRRGAGRAACRRRTSGPTARRPPSRSPRATQPSAARRLGRLRPRGGGRSRTRSGTRPASTDGQRRLVDLHHPPVDAGQPAAQVGEVAPYALGERLRELAPGAVVGQHQVAARPLDGRRQRPRPGDLGLERADVALRLLLDLVEVLGEQAAGAALVDALARR